MSTPAVVESDEIVEAQIRSRIARIRQAIATMEAQEAISSFRECREAAERALNRLADFENQLDVIPPIDVVVLGPSRHGKSTLLNSLVATDLLPTSDVKPCTASILTLTWSAEWSVTVRFVGREQVVRDWKNAVKDAEEALNQQRSQNDEVSADDPRFVKTTLQRFIQLFGIDPNLPPEELLAAVRKSEIPAGTAKLLGQTATVRNKDLPGIKAAIAQYLSTKDVYWTIVDRCEIKGPFPDWHSSLKLVDLPGTNDTDPQRTIVTNSLRDSATAVAVVTSDSNLGIDIESWLRNSSMLANFMEATNERRQRLFIIRTKLDAYHPNVEAALSHEMSEDEEAEVHRKAVEDYKREQTQTYRTMLRDIASPKLPAGDDESSKEKRRELLSRIDDIPVFFVSALAHEVFSGRFVTPRKNQRMLGDYFDNDIDATGIPDLRRFLLNVANEYLQRNFYEDIRLAIESEVRLMADTFRKAAAAAKAEAAGGRENLELIVSKVRNEIIPWLNALVAARAGEFESSLITGASGIRQRLSQVEAMSERRFADKIQIWTGLHWASLRAVARKRGVHTTGRGRLIDINEDICSVLIDDVLLAWTHFRDHLISTQLTEITNDVGEAITARLRDLHAGHGIPEVAEAVHHITTQLIGITEQQRLELLQRVNAKIQEVQSIRRPAYDIAREEMAEVFSGIEDERGAGCSYRMQETIRRRAPDAIQRIRDRINRLVFSVVDGLSEGCTSALTTFGASAANRIDSAITHVAESLQERDSRVLEGRVRVLSSAIRRLPGPDTAA
ncbi:MAG: dynamin family protein [Planctomycetaceae bacterium]|nr:dynamin family protein [Planctomycetaceae bacterium]